MSVSTKISLAVACVASAIAMPVCADIVVGWTMPTAFPTGAGNVPTGLSYLAPGPNGAGVADQGANFAGSQIRSVHTDAVTSYTSPAGNGSAYSFSSNYWRAGNFYEISFSNAGFSNTVLSWDQTRSQTGPATSTLLMSTDGGANWTTLISSYSVIINAAAPSGAGAWNSTTYNAAYTTTLALGAAADGQSSVIIRFQALVDAITPSTGLFSSGGTNRIDNVFVNGTAVPAPGALALLGVAGLVGSRRRR